MASICDHRNAEMVPSYYSDTEWCPECGAVRGTDGKFGPGSKMLDWKSPSAERDLYIVQAHNMQGRLQVVAILRAASMDSAREKYGLASGGKPYSTITQLPAFGWESYGVMEFPLV